MLISTQIIGIDMAAFFSFAESHQLGIGLKGQQLLAPQQRLGLRLLPFLPRVEDDHGWFLLDWPKCVLKVASKYVWSN